MAYTLHTCDFDIAEMTIETVTGVEWNIENIISEVNIYEDLFGATVSAQIVINDTKNQIANFPITGHEYVRLSFRKPNADYIAVRLRIYKISNREQEKERYQVYILHCVDNAEFVNARTRVSKAYKQMLISDIAEDVQTQFLGSPFVNIEATQNLHHIIPAQWSPFKTMNFLAARANSAVYKGANYVYFQTVDGFNFRSIESLCDTEPSITYLSQPANIRDLSVVEGYKPRTLETDTIAIQSYKIVNNYDSLGNINAGMYSSRLLWLDLRNQQYGEKDFSYPESYPDYIHVEKNVVVQGESKLWTSKSDFNSAPYGAFKLYSVGQPEQQNHSDKWLLSRISQMSQLENVRMHLTVPGDSNCRVGDIANILLPSPEPLINNQLVYEKHIQGRYLVTSVCHRLTTKAYFTDLEVVKDSVFTAFP